MNDSLERLKKSIDGRAREDNTYAEVNPDDILAVCETCPLTPRMADLRMGSLKATRLAPVLVKVIDIAFLIEQSGK